MAYDGQYLNTVSSGKNSLAPTVWEYISSGDTLATIVASAYFNNAQDGVGGAGRLRINDFMLIKGSDAASLYYVTAVTPNVTMSSATVANIVAGSIVLADLATGVAPSHVVKYGGNFTTVGGDATEVITVTGATTNDFVLVDVKTAGATPRSIVAAAITGADTVTVTMSGDPSNDHVLSYMVFRTAA
jgi:hypothetical protein